MKGLISCRWWFGLLGLVWIGMNSATQAWKRPPVKVNTVFQLRVDIKVGPDIQRPAAPWYAYFPADARMLPSMQSSPYPPWPQQFPPQGPPADASKDALKKTSADNVPPRPMPTAHWSNHYAQGSNLQPVGYVPVQAPSYWYQGR